MREEAKRNEEADRREKERIEKINAADSLIFQTEKQLKEFGDKLPADKKASIEAALGKLKDAHKSQNLAAIENATNELNAAWQAASEELYKAQAQANAGAGQQANANAGSSSSSGNDQEVTDVDFEEVK